MATLSRVRPKIGDVIELPLPGGGFGYALYTHKHPIYGSLLRVVRGVFQTLPTDLVALVQPPAQFITFFPLGAACHRRYVRIVGSVPIPDEFVSFPTFRAGVPSPDGQIDTWWTWDGVNETYVGALTPEIAAMPSRGIINDTLLFERIESGWNDNAA
jgi:hypothetical protein